MEKKNNALKIFWLIIPVALVLGMVAVFDKKSRSLWDSYLFTSLLAAALCAWGYLSFRVIIFRRKLVYFIKRILGNEYQSGIKINPGFSDEITCIEKLVNMMADQLRSYDQLQIDKICALTRALDIVYHNVKDGIIVYNKDKNNFQINPVVQQFFEVEQENFSYDSLAKQEANRDFIAKLKEAIDQGKSCRDLNLVLELPIRQSKRELQLTIIPIKDKNELVELAVIFVTRAN
jgi:hypothetical protein